MNDKDNKPNIKPEATTQDVGLPSTSLLCKKIQSVYITLDDGTVAQFSGRAVCDIGDTRVIKAIQFGEPRELPEDCSFFEI